MNHRPHNKNAPISLARPITLRLRKLLGVCMLTMVMWLGAVSTALASDPDVDVTFKELRVYKQKGEVMLDYKISRETWKAMRDVSIEPRLNIFTPSKGGRYVYRYSVPLKDRQGRILYNKRDVQLRGADIVKIELVGYNGSHRVGRLSLDAQCDTFLNVEVERESGGHSSDDGGHHDHDGGHGGGGHGGGVEEAGSSRADIIKACDRETSFGSELDRCVEAGMALPFSRASGLVIQACGEATSYGSGLQICLEQAALLVGSPVEAVRACDAATSYDSELGSCMKKAVEFNHVSAGDVIAACDAHTSFSSELNACVDAASGLRRNHVAIINACGDATSYSSELKRCIQKAAK